MTPAPYPADTRAKGWRFELDHERVRQSDTWALTPKDIRPWLLMLWMVAWEQTPCGSLPDDDSLIAARLDMAPKSFAKARANLMRGWLPAEDGRLYHQVMTERVLEMMRKRRSDAERTAAKRARDTANNEPSPPGVTRDIRVSTVEVTSEFDTEHRRDITEDKKNPPTPRKRGKGFDASSIGLPEWLDTEAWQEWCADRMARGKPITERAAAQQLSKLDEYRRAGTRPESVLSHAIASGHQGLYPPPSPAKANGEHFTASEQAARRRILAAVPNLAAKSAQSLPEIIDVSPAQLGRSHF